MFYRLKVLDTCFKAPDSKYPAYLCINRLKTDGIMSRQPAIARQRSLSTSSVLFGFCHVSRAIATKRNRLGDDKQCYTAQTRSNLVFVKNLVHWLHYCSLCGLPKRTYRAISGVVGGPRQSRSCRYCGLLKLNIAANI